MFGRRKKSAEWKVGTIIGKEVEIVGNVRGGGPAIRIEGVLEGSVINDGDLYISSTGKILGELKANNIKVAGEVHGNIDTQSGLEILSTGRVIGDIKVASLIVDEGAFFQGKSEMVKSSPKLPSLDGKKKESVVQTTPQTPIKKV